MNTNKKPYQIIDEAEILAEQGHAEKAIQLLRSLLIQYPGLVKARMALGRIYLQSNFVEDAKNCFTLIINKHPKNKDAQFLLAKSLWMLGEFDLAIINAKNITLEIIDAPWPSLLLAETYIAADKKPHALKILNTLLKKYPGNLSVIKLTFGILRTERSIESATDLLKQSLLHTDNPWVHEQLIKIHLYSEPDFSREHLTHCLSKYSKHMPFKVDMAKAMEINGENNQAIEFLTNCYHKHPLPTIGLNLLRILIKTEQFEEASLLQTTLINKFPKNIHILEQSIQLFLAMEDYIKAEDCLSNLESIHPNHLYYYIYNAKLLIQLGQHENAIFFFDKGREWHASKPIYWMHYLQLSIRCYQMNYFTKAKTVVLEEFLDNFLVIKTLAQILIRIGQYSESIASLEQCKVTEKGQVAELHSLIARAQLHDMSLHKSFENYSFAIDLNPKSPQFYTGRAHASVLTPLHQQARKDFVTAQNIILKRTGENNYALGDYYGQLLNEMQANPSALKVIEKVFEQPSIPAYINLLSKEPNYTPGHASLLMLARNSGYFSNKNTLITERKIPKNIFQFWDTNELPADVAYLTSSWKKHHPNWNYHCFNENQAIRFLASSFHKSVVTAFVQAPQAAMKSDLFRLAALYQHGGIYTDADDLCIKSLEPLFSSGKSLYLYQEYVGSVGNNFIAVKENHPVIAAALQEAVSNILDNPLDYVWLATGPGLITRKFSQFFISNLLETKSIEGDWHILTVEALHEFSLIHCNVDYKRTEQHWIKAKVS